MNIWIRLFLANKFKYKESLKINLSKSDSLKKKVKLSNYCGRESLN